MKRYTIILLLISTLVSGQTLQKSHNKFAFSGDHFLLSEPTASPSSAQIIADHTVVDLYDDIPEYYITEVKKMFLNIPGQSHSGAYRYGLEYLEIVDANYAVNVDMTDEPETYTDSYLRVSSVTWGDISSATGWVHWLDETSWFTSELAIERMEASCDYINTNGWPMTVFGFGWCYAPLDDYSYSLGDYLEATQDILDYCHTQDYSTKVIFTTGPVDEVCSTGQTGYYSSIRWQQIRDYVVLDDTRILFDYADILCYDSGNETPNTATWDGHTYPIITSTNLGDASVAHISYTGALRLAKAMWWMLARIAGWNGVVE